MVLALGAAIIAQATRGGFDPFLAWNGMLVVGLVVARQALSLHENVALNALLAAREGELRRRALEDPLTGLANRSVLDENLAEALRFEGEAGHVAVLVLDLDGFNAVNDTLGHACGDPLLQIVAGRLCEHRRAGDTLVRLGGDDFVIVLAPLPAERERERERARASAHALADRLAEALARPMVLDDTPVAIGASVGVAVAARGDGHSPESLVREADAAMYRAKAARRRAGPSPVPAGAVGH